MELYLTEQGTKVRKESQRLIFEQDKIIKQVRISEISQIFVFGKIHFTTNVLQELLKRGIPVHFLTATGRYLGKLTSLNGKDVKLRIAQFRCFENREKRLDFARKFIIGKIENQRSFLRKRNKNLRDEEIGKVILELKGLAEEVKKCRDIESLRGLEGRASAVYFSVYGKLFQTKGLIFPGRVKRPPTDPINAVLSLGYMLLFSKVLTFLNVAGFDIYLGFLHTPEYGKPALALDLMEEWRPVVVDSLVVNLFNLGVIRPEDFTEIAWDDEEDMTPLRLSPQGLKKFLVQFNRRLEEKYYYERFKKQYALKDIINYQVKLFKKAVLGEEEYESVKV